jgi:NADPH:quinone reductase
VEGAGVVESVGEGVSNVKPSDRVAFTDQPGAYSEAILADAERLIPLRKSIRPTRVKGQLRQHLGSLLFVKPLSIARLR